MKMERFLFNDSIKKTLRLMQYSNFGFVTMIYILTSFLPYMDSKVL